MTMNEGRGDVNALGGKFVVEQPADELLGFFRLQYLRVVAGQRAFRVAFVLARPAAPSATKKRAR